jgi:hypothetical protein
MEAAMKNNVEKATLPPPPEGWPEPLGEAAYHGVLGDIVAAIAPETEADPANVLISGLVAIGNAIGRKPRIKLGPTWHHTNEYLLVVGDTSQGRKGTGLDEIRNVFKASAVDVWEMKCIQGGLSTGEGLIAHFVPHDDKPIDKRLLAVEPEFARILIVMNRSDNTLSTNIRALWETGNANIKTRKNPLSVRGAHVSIIGHITPDELRKYLVSIHLASGLANRFLFVLAKQSNILPFGGAPDYRDFISKLDDKLAWASQHINFSESESFNKLWAAWYTQMNVAKRPGLIRHSRRTERDRTRELALLDQLIDIASREGNSLDHLQITERQQAHVATIIDATFLLQ